MNIEKTISEHAVSDILTPMLESQDRIVTEDVAPLFNKATGLDTPSASGSVTTTIEESRSVIIAIIRKAWTATLTMLGGASVISYIAAAYTYLRNRLQGSETYGIPDRRSEISVSSPLAANLALLNDRKIGGVPEAADGMSLIHLMTDTSEVTELTDDNRDWNLTSVKFGLFPNATKIQAWFKDAVMNWGYSVSNVYILNSAVCTEFDMRYFEEAKITGGNVAATYLFRDMGALTKFNLDSLRKITSGLFYNCDALTEVVLPSLKEVGTGVVIGCDNVERVVADELERVNGYTNAPALIANNPKLKYASFPKLNYWYIYGAGTGGGSLMNMPLLEELIIGKAPFTSSSQFYRHVLEGCESLIKLDLRGDLNQNIYLDGWSPTLDSSNLQQFLSNFRDYIANRLTDNGSGKTLTLSQAVRNAIHAAEATYGIENIIITNKGWTISPAPN